jgi:Sulfotransferase domain.
MERVDAIIAGVNKAGTTSLYVSLAEHPDVAASAIKETRYFLPARYGQALKPVSVWHGYFAAADRPVRLEATPSYFYGGADVAHAIRSTVPNPKIVLVLREPVSRALSFFEYQKVRLRLPQDLAIEDYLAHADALTDRDFDDPNNEKYMAIRGGRYADWLPQWWDVLGADAVKVVYFEDLTASGDAVLRDVAEFLGLDPELLGSTGLRSENRTTSFKYARLQSLALRFNDGFERLLRKAPSVKRRLRSMYLAVNGRATAKLVVSDAIAEDLQTRFDEPNRRLAALLDGAGIARPPWLPTE